MTQQEVATKLNELHNKDMQFRNITPAFLKKLYVDAQFHPQYYQDAIHTLIELTLNQKWKVNSITGIH